MLRTLLIGLTLCLASNSVWAQDCADIRHVDLKNATIHVGAHDQNDLQDLFNASRRDSRTFRLRNGVGLTYDASVDSKTPDWRTELVMNREVHPEPSIWIRVIGLEDVHMTGTGTWFYILALGCEKGHLVRKFQFSSEAVELKYLDNQTLQLTQGIWSPTDDHADPSGHRELTYKWDAGVHRYRLAPTISGNGARRVPSDR